MADNFELSISAIATDSNSERMQTIIGSPSITISELGGPRKVTIPASTGDVPIVLGITTVDHLVLRSDGELEVNLNGTGTDAIDINGFFVVQGGSITTVHVTNNNASAVTLEVIAIADTT